MTKHKYRMSGTWQHPLEMSRAASTAFYTAPRTMPNQAQNHSPQKNLTEASDEVLQNLARRSLVGFSQSNVNATAFFIKVNIAIDQRENRVIFPDANVAAGMPLGATLTEDDIASDHFLATKLLHAKTLTARIASVLDGTLSFLMSHGAK